MFSLIKHTTKDIIKLYKNFFHWNISKVSIGFFSLIISIVSLIPVLFISLILLTVLGVDWYAYLGHIVQDTINENMVFHIDFLLMALFSIINGAIFIFGLNYSKVMYFHMNAKYLDHKKAKINKMKFFHIPIIWNYYKLSGLMICLLFIPLLIMILLFLFFIIILGGVEQAGEAFNQPSLFLALSTLLIFLFWLISSIYLSYRIYFSYILFIDTKESEEFKFSAKKILRKSFKITKGGKNFFKLFTLLLLFSIVMIPFTFISEGLNGAYSGVKTYQEYSQLSQDEKKNIPQENIYYFAQLEIKYQELSPEDIQKNIQLYYIMIILSSIFGFIFVTGIIEMIMSSFYKRVLTHK